MTVQEIFELSIKIGIKNDPRGEKEVAEELKEIKKDYAELPAKKKADFDADRLTNPYADTNIGFLADSKKQIKRVLVGIDIDVAEVLLAKELERAGKKIDLIIAHHPLGKSTTDLHQVMMIQSSVLTRAGIPENIAEGVVAAQLESIQKGVAPENHYQAISASQLLSISIMNIHTPADNSVWKFVDEYLAKKKLRHVSDVLDALKEIPEYKSASKQHAGPTIFVGTEKSRVGKIAVSGMTGGTSGKNSEKIYERMAHYGIGTEIAMHAREADREEAAKHFINLIIAGHIASDSIGMNIIMDQLEKQGVEIVPCSGYLRHSRL